MKSWYLLYCKAAQLQRAKTHPERQSVICHTPLLCLHKTLCGKTVLAREPLFPNDLSVAFDIEHIHTSTVSATRGVSHFIRFGDHPVIVPPEVIMQILHHPQADNARIGDKVIITDGQFSGLEAIFTETDGEMRSILFLDFISQQKRLAINSRHFKKRAG